MPPLPSTLRLWAYDRVMLRLSTAWYAHILEHTEPGSHLLDVGCGPWSAQAANAELLRQRDLRLTGLDIDAGYLRAARQRVAQAGCSSRVDLLPQRVEAHQGGPYDGACLVASVMLLDDPVAALHHVASRLRPGAPLWLALTIMTRPSPVAEAIKPHLHHLTTVRFGRVTYADTLDTWLQGAGLTLVKREETGRSEPFAWWVVQTRA